ncbi:hypothetical protein [Chitinophaga polysaccharea]|nr:hypothetical protein [Chitinophaga polysaccharea]
MKRPAWLKANRFLKRMAAPGLSCNSPAKNLPVAFVLISSLERLAH